VTPLSIPVEKCTDLREALRREWLETNGLGSFACGTVAGASTRRYHAILCAATRPPVGRMVLVNNLEVALSDGKSRWELSTNLYPNDTVHPEGYRALGGFRLDPWPIWTWRVGPFTVERELFMPHRAQATVVRFRVRGGPATLTVRPLLSGRDYHATHHENSTLSNRARIEDRVVAFEPYPGVPSVRVHHDGHYHHEPDWYRRFQLPREGERGLDCEEDLFSPGSFHFWLGDGDGAHLIFSIDPRATWDVKALADAERARRETIASAMRSDPLARLAIAADQFLVARGEASTVIAGYPWFTDWGRDTFIALPGLTLSLGRAPLARQLLEAFAAQVDGGMIPNRFPDGESPPEYNTVDAPLWYVIAAGRYLRATGDELFVRTRLWEAIKKIVEGYRRSTRHRISVDSDGLVYAGEDGVQLTWMDAKVGDWVVTPRIGKPIEIQALWIRVLAVAADLARTFSENALAAELDALREKSRASIAAAFWYQAGGYLYDVIDGASRDASLRPNQLYALALDPAVIDKTRAASALATVERELLTPFGLRTLSPRDAAYHGRCAGDQRDRDAAYHQGTVWPHLLGVYADACHKVRGERVGQRVTARLLGWLTDEGMGQLPEIFDGDVPHEPRGCFAQAWAVSEIARLVLDEV
jgi:predicted glycogen debranching enzyme